MAAGRRSGGGGEREKGKGEWRMKFWDQVSVDKIVEANHEGEAHAKVEKSDLRQALKLSRASLLEAPASELHSTSV
jgi:hypothetical protein